MDGFADRGGVIGLVMEGHAVRFVINRTAASQAGLRISSRLLSLARLAGTDAPGATVPFPVRPDRP